MRLFALSQFINQFNVDYLNIKKKKLRLRAKKKLFQSDGLITSHLYSCGVITASNRSNILLK